MPTSCPGLGSLQSRSRGKGLDTSCLPGRERQEELCEVGNGGKSPKGVEWAGHGHGQLGSNPDSL